MFCEGYILILRGEIFLNIKVMPVLLPKDTVNILNIYSRCYFIHMYIVLEHAFILTSENVFNQINSSLFFMAAWNPIL